MMEDVKDDGINLRTDAVNKLCKGCKEKCKQSCKVTVVYCPNKTKQKGEEEWKSGVQV